MDWFGNVFIVPFEVYDRQFRLVPPAWSLAVEIINYALLWLFTARSGAAAITATFAGALFHLVALNQGVPFAGRYTPCYAAVLPFALGALIYFARGRVYMLTNRTALLLTAVLGGVWIANTIAFVVAWPRSNFYRDLFFYANVLLLTALIAGLSHESLSSRLKVVGRKIGDLAYPMFLCHWIVGFVIGTLGSSERGFGLLALSAIPILTVSWLLAMSADGWLEPLRATIRRNAALSSKPWGMPRSSQGMVWITDFSVWARR